jgi:ankyrin repeat protein
MASFAKYLSWGKKSRSEDYISHFDDIPQNDDDYWEIEMENHSEAVLPQVDSEILKDKTNFSYPAREVSTFDNSSSSKNVSINNHVTKPTTSKSNSEAIIETNSTAEDLNIKEILFSRVRHNRYDFVKEALHEDAKQSTITDDKGNTLLHICAQNNLRKMASLVLSYGCSLNAKNKKGLTALDYCAKYAFGDMSVWLIGEGATYGSNSAPTAGSENIRPLR